MWALLIKAWVARLAVLGRQILSANSIPKPFVKASILTPPLVAT
jgi:hypothetical protein